MITLQNASVTFPGGVDALKSVSLTINPGEFTVIIGGSGAGKSTLLRCCNMLQRPTAGRVLVDGANPARTRQSLVEHRRKTAMVFQLHHLIGRQTALDNVLLGRMGFYGLLRSILPLPEADVQLGLHCLERVGIRHKASVRVTQLSGGERQRVGVARALVQQPRMILADEPIASLDPVTARTVLQILFDVCKADNITAVVTLHQVDMAREFADRIIGMAAGELVFDGPPSQLDDAAIQRIYPQGQLNESPDGRRTRDLFIRAPSCSGDVIMSVDE